MSKKNCNRCKEPIGDHWSENWPMYGRIVMGYHSRIFDIAGYPWSENGWGKVSDHPAVAECPAQEITVQWHSEPMYPEHWANRVDDPYNLVAQVDGRFKSAPCRIGWAEYDRALKAGEFRSGFVLCKDCQKKLIRTVMDFFGISNPATDDTFDPLGEVVHEAVTKAFSKTVSEPTKATQEGG